MPKWAISLLGIHVFPTIQVFLGALAARTRARVTARDRSASSTAWRCS